MTFLRITNLLFDLLRNIFAYCTKYVSLLLTICILYGNLVRGCECVCFCTHVLTFCMTLHLVWHRRQWVNWIDICQYIFFLPLNHIKDILLYTGEVVLFICLFRLLPFCSECCFSIKSVTRCISLLMFSTNDIKTRDIITIAQTFFCFRKWFCRKSVIDFYFSWWQ